ADYAEITAGLEEGDEVVMNGLFLIDSESAVDADLSRISGQDDSLGNDTQWVTLTIDAIDGEAGTVTASHGPVAAWDWPAMTMDFAIGEQVSQAELNSGIRLDAELNRNTDGMVEIIAIDTGSIESSVPSATVDGTINSIDEQNHTMNISRGAIEKWGRGPATMDFTLSSHIIAADWQPEQAIRFTFEIRDGEFVITHIEPAMAMSHDMDHTGH
ncbi:MAG TPA: efflux transporter periplasmic adaptor subunit, partial [Alteromonas sp.]|nr:efflux transporter periplasmic adaptor subunit [Alteromonas sp.]